MHVNTSESHNPGMSGENVAKCPKSDIPDKQVMQFIEFARSYCVMTLDRDTIR